MENFFKLIHSFISSFSGFLYNPWVPLFLVIGGFYLAFRTKFVQFRLFKESIKVVSEKKWHSKQVIEQSSYSEND